MVSGLIRRREREKKIFGRKTTYLAFGTLAGGFDPIATFDDIGFQAYRTRTTMEFQEETTGVAENRAEFISAPKRSGRRTTILANRL